MVWRGGGAGQKLTPLARGHHATLPAFCFFAAAPPRPCPRWTGPRRGPVRDVTKMKNKPYTKELRKLQAQLCQLQEWVKHKGHRVIVVFEGRDTAGKGGTIRALTERVSPRVFRVAALPAPSDREKTQLYLQRYMAQFP